MFDGGKMSHSWQIMLHGMGGADCGDGEQGRCTVQGALTQASHHPTYALAIAEGCMQCMGAEIWSDCCMHNPSAVVMQHGMQHVVSTSW